MQPPDLKRYEAILKLHAAMAARGIRAPTQPDLTNSRPTEAFDCEFAGLQLVIEPDVFEPGPVSFAVVEALARACIGIDAPVVADVGTGSGAIALAFAQRCPNARVYALDISAAAVACATRNAERLALRNVTVLQGRLLEPLLGEGRILDAVAANIPWVPAAIADVKELLRPDRWRGPRETIVGTDVDGLGLLRQLVTQADTLLQPDGCLILEMDDWQTTVFAQEYGSTHYVEIDPTCHFVILRAPAAESRPVL